MGDRPPTLGPGRLIAVDGRSGAGKSTLAAHISAQIAVQAATQVAAGEAVPTTRVITLDDLYPGWSGLPQTGEILDRLLRPLAAGGPGSYRRWDWHRSAPGELVRVDPVDLLIIEGVGAGSAAISDLIGCLVWIESPAPKRRARALARDGETFAPHWDAWAEAEAAYLRHDHPQTRADLVISDPLC